MRNHLNSWARQTRLAAVALASLLLLAFVVPQPSAFARSSASVKLTIGTVSGSAGQTVDIPVSIAAPTRGVAAYNVEIGFDPAVLTVQQVTAKYGSTDLQTCGDAAQGCFASGFDNAAGTVRAAWSDSSGGAHPIAAANNLFIVRVKIGSAAGLGNVALTIDSDNPEALSFLDSDVYPLNVDLVPGSLKVVRPTVPDSPPETGSDNGGVAVIVDGKPQEQSATLTRSKQNGAVVATIQVDNDKVLKQLEAGTVNRLTIPVSGTADVVVSRLNGQLVKALANKAAVVEIQTPQATYTLPASEIGIDAISSQVGTSVSLADIPIEIRIAAADDQTAKQIQAESAREGASLVGTPISFEVQATYGGRNIDVSQFNSYVERSIALPDGIDPSRITTGVVLNADGTFTHVPTVVTESNGRSYAHIRSLTNSVYSVIWHPVTFKDVAQHWSRDDVNDLASRLIVTGASAASFDPNRSVTRAEFAAILTRALGLHDVKTGAAAADPAGYSDVTSGQWYAQPIRIASSYGLIGGYEDGTYRPNRTISRQEAMVLIARAMKLAGTPGADSSASGTAGALTAFSDSGSIASWAADSASLAVQAGLFGGSGGKLNPGSQLTRAETAAIVHRLLVQSSLINP